MPNGQDINDSDFAKLIWDDPFYGYPGTQDIMTLPDPVNENGYYLIHKTPWYHPTKKDSFEIRCSYIDMRLDQGRGDVVYKNKSIYPKRDLIYCYLTAVPHSNGHDWWILQLGLGKSIKTFLLDKDGIRFYKDQDSKHLFTAAKTSASGTAKFSPDGRKYAIFNEEDNLLVYSFDRVSGILTFDKEYIPIDTSGQGIFCSVEWSPSGRFIYCASSEYLHQVDTWESNPSKSIQLIDKYNGTLDPFTTRLYLMSQAPDCKIYMAPKNGSYSLHVINKPDELGKACDFVQNGIKLPGQNGGSLPNFPRFRVDEIDKCDPTISSIFGESVYYRRELHVYPVPSSGIFYITPPSQLGISKLVVTDINSTILQSFDIRAGDMPDHIDIGHLPAGHYNIEIYPTDSKERIFYGRQVVKI